MTGDPANGTALEEVNWMSESDDGQYLWATTHQVGNLGHVYRKALRE